MTLRQRLDEIRQLAEKATPGPWTWYVQQFPDEVFVRQELLSMVTETGKAHGLQEMRELHGVGVETDMHTLYAALTGCGPQSPENAALIAALRNTIGPLLDVVEAQHRALEAMRSAYPHESPFDCFATGPLTGDALQDFVACPGCAAEKAARAALSLMDKEDGNAA